LIELSQSGEIIQRTPATNVFSVQALDLNGDGDMELHHESAGHTCALSSNSHDAPDCLIEERKGWLQFHYSGGKTEELLLETPGHTPDSVWRLRDGSTAAVRTIQATAHLSAFMMWDSTGNPVYTHVFPFSTLGLAAFIDGEGQERLLLGAGTSLLEVTRKGG
ncbi:MAG: hypothetical protein QGH51_10660, partial [Planctomycetota bacterium]|nr:hypothetical protein [Planctomycetota bacterium]